MRVVGIDPGTMSFDLCGLSDEGVILDSTIPSAELNSNPNVLFDLLDSIAPLDLIVGHSGLGTSLKKGGEIGGMEIAEMLLAPQRELEGKNTPDLIQAMYKLYRDPRIRDYPFVFIPGVVHLSTVPEYRKINKIDLGTADKLCCAVLGVKDQAEALNIPYGETSFILIELGFGFNAALSIVNGRIVDGAGGTNLGPGFLAQGSLDAELARIFHYITEAPPTRLTFASGGVMSISGNKELTPEEFGKNHDRYPIAWEAYIEGILKAISAMSLGHKPREILVSGRLSGLDEILGELSRRCALPVRRLGGLKDAKTAKHAAQGAAILADGLAGGRYKKIADIMQIKNAKGTLLDHIYFQKIGKNSREILQKIWES